MFFLQQKAKTLAFDHLVKLCADFYRKDEVIAARSLVEQAVSKRLTRRQGGDAHKCTIEDILKVVLDPGNKLPIFFAVDLDRVPPVDIEP